MNAWFQGRNPQSWAQDCRDWRSGELHLAGGAYSLDDDREITTKLTTNKLGLAVGCMIEIRCVVRVTARRAACQLPTQINQGPVGQRLVEWVEVGVYPEGRVIDRMIEGFYRGL